MLRRELLCSGHLRLSSCQDVVAIPDVEPRQRPLGNLSGSLERNNVVVLERQHSVHSPILCVLSYTCHWRDLPRLFCDEHVRVGHVTASSVHECGCKQAWPCAQNDEASCTSIMRKKSFNDKKTVTPYSCLCLCPCPRHCWPHPLRSS